MIFIIVIAALAGGLVFFGSNISNSVTTIANLRQDIVNRSATLRLLASLRSQYLNQGQTYLNVLHNVIPAKDQLIDLPKDFQSLANQQNIGFGFSFAGESAAMPNGLGSVTFRLNVQSASLDELLKFVDKLQNFHYLSTLDSFNLSHQDKNIQMVIIGRVFYRQ